MAFLIYKESRKDMHIAMSGRRQAEVYEFIFHVVKRRGLMLHLEPRACIEGPHEGIDSIVYPP
jgi:hypothetical protein